MRRRFLVALVVFAITVIALACFHSATPPTETPAPTFTPPTPHPYQPPFLFEIDAASSYGFDRIYLARGTWGAEVFEISRGKSATIIVIVTSASNKTLDIRLGGFTGVPAGVELRMEPERFTLQPNEQIALKLTITVSPTAPTSTPSPTPTPTETWTPEPLPTPGAPETPTVTPTPEPPIPADFIEFYLLTGEYEGGGRGFLLSIV